MKQIEKLKQLSKSVLNDKDYKIYYDTIVFNDSLSINGVKYYYCFYSNNKQIKESLIYIIPA